jgi:hypothetical protein
MAGRSAGSPENSESSQASGSKKRTGAAWWKSGRKRDKNWWVGWGRTETDLVVKVGAIRSENRKRGALG